jgi:hypothetical protein
MIVILFFSIDTVAVVKENGKNRISSSIIGGGVMNQSIESTLSQIEEWD